MDTKTKISQMTKEKLIELIRNYPCLYDKSSMDYKDNFNAWREIGSTLNLKGEILFFLNVRRKPCF